MKSILRSEKNLMNLAVFYCSKRETSRSSLRKYLQRKCREEKGEASVYNGWIESVLDACEKSKVIDDGRYADILVREYTRRGKGTRYIEQKLKSKGIHKDLWNIPKDDDAEFSRAVTLANKIIKSLKSKISRKAERKSRQNQKSKSFKRPTDEKFELKQKMIQKLIASGFSIDICKKAVNDVMQALVEN